MSRPPAFLCAIFEADHGDPRRVLRRKFDELEAYSATLPGLPHSVLQAYTSAPLAGKNRYRLILPLSEARVRLPPLSTATSDYINANYAGPGNRYIATQAPVPRSFSDFWRMVWAEQVLLILMLVRVLPRKADCYWPTEVGKPVVFSDCQLAVELAGEDRIGDGLTRRVFRVGTPDCTRLVTHLHYEHWPDHGPPTSFQAFSALHSAVTGDTRFKTSPPPVVVHCSAGVGRTGTFIVIDSVLEALKHGRGEEGDGEGKGEGGKDLIMDLIKENRRHRPWFVETEEQFIFIYEYIWWRMTTGKAETA